MAEASGSVNSITSVLFVLIPQVFSLGLVFLVEMFKLESKISGWTGIRPKTSLGGIALVAAGIYFVYSWMMFRVVAARSNFGVKWPNLYATKAENKHADAFNSVQRAHQQSLELYPQFIVCFLIAHQVYPNVAVHAGLLFCLGRLIFGWLYGDFGPNARHVGTVVTLIAQWIVQGIVIKFAVESGLGLRSVYGPLSAYLK